MIGTIIWAGVAIWLLFGFYKEYIMHQELKKEFKILKADYESLHYDVVHNMKSIKCKEYELGEMMKCRVKRSVTPFELEKVHKFGEAAIEDLKFRVKDELCKHIHEYIEVQVVQSFGEPLEIRAKLDIIAYDKDDSN